VHVHTEMFPVISETYIGEDIAALEASGAVVTVSALEDAVSRAENAPVCRLDVDAAIEEAQPDVVLMHWATHADVNLPLMERHNTPFACRVHTFDVDRDLVSHLLAHPLCVAVFAHPPSPFAVAGRRSTAHPDSWRQTIIPESTSPRDLVLSVSAGLPKKDFRFSSMSCRNCLNLRGRLFWRAQTASSTFLKKLQSSPRPETRRST